MRSIGEGQELTTASGGSLVSSGLNEQEVISPVGSHDYIGCGPGVRLPYAPPPLRALIFKARSFFMSFENPRVVTFWGS